MKLQNTKQKILDASLDFFSKHGYSGASIRQIAREVGVRESAIYNHYKSKEEIFNSILDEFKSRTITTKILSDDLLDDLVNPEKFLKHFAARLIDHWNSHDERKFIRLLLMEQFTKIGSRELSVTEHLTELRSICKMIFGEMAKHGVIKEIDPELLAEEFTAQLFFIRTELLSGDNPEKIKLVHEKVSRHVEFFWNGIKA